jgi:hypothetical protein
MGGNPIHQRIEELEAQLQNSNVSQTSYQQLAWILYHDGQLEAVQALLHDATRRFPDDPELHYLEGLLLKKSRSMLSAQRSFLKVVEISGDSPKEVRLQVLNHLARMMLATLSGEGNE